jgi:hypothetical protein
MRWSCAKPEQSSVSVPPLSTMEWEMSLLTLASKMTLAAEELNPLLCHQLRIRHARGS